MDSVVSVVNGAAAAGHHGVSKEHLSEVLSEPCGRPNLRIPIMPAASASQLEADSS